MSMFNTLNAIEQQTNVAEELSRIILEKCWAADDMEVGIRYELAALAGGINAAAILMRELYDQLKPASGEPFQRPQE